jgi:hypothetical protein
MEQKIRRLQQQQAQAATEKDELMPGKSTSGNRTERRGHPTRRRLTLDTETARTLHAVAAAWQMAAEQVVATLVTDAWNEIDTATSTSAELAATGEDEYAT